MTISSNPQHQPDSSAVLQAFLQASRELREDIYIRFGKDQAGLSYEEIDVFRTILKHLPAPAAGHNEPLIEKHDPLGDRISQYLKQSQGEPGGPAEHTKRFDDIALIYQIVHRLIEDGHLSEPATDDWQECAFEDIQKGDRVRAVSPNGDLTEFTVRSVDRLLAHGKYDEVAHTTRATFYRIPAPVQHPDPAVHQYVLVHEFKSENPSWVMPVLGEANDDQSGYYINGLFRHATEITEWQHLTPAKVVEDDR